MELVVTIDEVDPPTGALTASDAGDDEPPIRFRGLLELLGAVELALSRPPAAPSERAAPREG